MTNSSLQAPIELRLSSLRMGSKTRSRLVWCVGVSKEFLSHVPEDHQRIKMSHKNGVLSLNLGTEGVKLSMSVRGRFAYANSLGEHHLTGMTTPEAEIKSLHLQGKFNPHHESIEFTSELPAAVISTFLDIEALKEETSVEAHFPGTHFMEDIKEIEADHADLTTDEGAAIWYEQRVARSKERVVTEQVDMTPALARVLVGHNDGNRPVRQAKLNQYISDINADRWDFNGETIIISKEGLVNNGQHRSLAVIETNKSIPVLFVFGVERSTRKTVDTGANRGAHDHLSVDGYTQPTTLAALTRFVLAYERNQGQNFSNMNRVTASEIYERATADPLLDISSQYPYKHGNKSKRLAPPSVISFCHYIMSKADSVMAQTFLDQVITGVNISADSPAYVTREKLMEFSSLVREQKVEVLFRGFMAFRKNKKIRGIRIKWELPSL